MSDIPSDVESSYKKSTSKCVPEGATNDQFTHVESSLAYHMSQNAWVPYSTQTSTPEFQQQFQKFINETPGNEGKVNK